MQIKSIKKKKNTYLVLIDETSYEIEESVLLDFRLKKMMILDEKMLDEIMKKNHKAFLIRKGIAYVAKNRSIRDFKKYLRTLTNDENLVTEITLDFKGKNYLNDYIYAESYLRINQSKYGKHKLQQGLIEKGITKELIDQMLQSLTEDTLEEQLKKEAQTIKKETYLKAKQTLLRRYLQKGYDEVRILSYIETYLDQSRFDETVSIEKYYKQALTKYQKRFDGHELNQKIYLYLRQKGYHPRHIKDILEKREW